MSLGSIIVRLTLDTATFDTDSGRAAKIAEKRSKEIHAAFTKAGIAIGTALGTAAVVVKRYVENTIEAEKVQAQLMARITDTYGAAGRSLEQLGAQADKLQGLTIFDDETIGQAQAMLLTFTNISGVQFDKTIESALDLATVMGTDATDAAKFLGRALSDPEKGMSALARAGVVFTDAERAAIKAMVDAGDSAGAQDRILAKLQGTMGSAAEAARNTLGGALAGLGNAFDNLLEGDTGSDGVRGTVTAINNLTDVVNDPATRQGLDNIAGGMANIAAQTIEGISAIARFQNALSTLSGISDKRAAGAPASAYSNKEIETTIALLSRGKRKALASGDDATAARLQKEITALIRENTKRIKDDLATEGVNRAFDGLFPKVNDLATANPPAGGRHTSSGRTGGSRRTARAFPDFRREDLDALQKMVEATAQANDQFDRMLATLSGPLAVAEHEHAQNLAEIAKTGTEAGRTSEDIARLKALEVKRFEEEKAAIEDRANPARAMLKDLEFEAALLKMTNADRAVAIQLRGMDADAVQEYGDKLRKANADLESMGEQVGLMDTFRESVRGIFSDIAHGASAWDAVKKAFDNFADAIFDFASKKVIEQLFGQMGTANTGSAGGGIWSLLGALTGGSRSGSSGSTWNGSLTGSSSTSSLGSGLLSIFGNSWGGFRAEGGPTYPSKAYIVGERGPELFVPSTDGVVMNRKQVSAMGAGRGLVQNITNNFSEKVDRRTRQQVESSMYRAGLAAAMRG